MLDKLTIAAALREIGRLVRLGGGPSFKARAYERGADAVEALPDLDAAVAKARLTEVPGIGPSIARLVAELHATGRSDLLEQLRARFPPGIGELAEIPGLGIGRIRTLHDALGIADVPELKAACLAGRVRAVPGFGPKTEQAILEGIAALERRGPRRTLLLDALEAVEPLVTHLRAAAGAVRVALVGSARRFCETVGDLDLLAAADDGAALLEALARHPRVSQVEAREAGAIRVRLGSGLPVDLKVVPDRAFAAALVWHTGSRAHLLRLGALAAERGLRLDESGLVRPDGAGAGPPARHEADLYGALGLPLIPPELREDAGEIEEAQAGDRFTDLLALGDVRGMTHCHTDWSDGRATIEEMARAAEQRGMDYLTITDHSASAHYAGGLSVQRLRAQAEAIAAVQARVGIRILRGTESDILADGSLDYPPEVLGALDIVIASIHARLKMGSAEMTERLGRMLALPWFKIWGHPLGRLVGRREPIACRVEDLLAAAPSGPAALEINGDPYRLDLEPRWIRLARRSGCRFVVSTDAHSVSALDNLRFAVGMARKGGVRRSEVLNTLDAGAFAEAVRPARPRP